MPNRIDQTLERLRRSGRPALAPFVTVGFPDVETSVALVRTVLEAGGHMLELGVPFSDPLADGPTVQMTSYRALQNGVTVKKCLEVLSELRESGVDAPMVLMGYYNPFLHYGLDRFLDDAQAAGMDGMIVPDLPTEEAEVLGRMASERGIHLIPLLAPTSSDDRIRDACKAAGGFIYCVSVTGVTGARRSLSEADCRTRGANSPPYRSPCPRGLRRVPARAPGGDQRVCRRCHRRECASRRCRQSPG